MAVTQLPPLIARVDSSVKRTTTGPWMVPSGKDWEAKYSVIQKLYVFDRRKLRHVMQYMESNYGWRATPQMYKKRFAKWGFSKNCKRTTPRDGSPYSDEAETNQEVVRKYSTPNIQDLIECEDVISRPDFLGIIDDQMIQLMHNVNHWSTEYFKSEETQALLACRPEDVPPIYCKVMEQRKLMGFSFRLVVSLLNRGEGVMAGRVARKAFVLAEETLLDLQPPTLFWNLLELLHHMLIQKHVPLFSLLLAHLSALVKDRLPSSHPVPAILQSLRKLVANFGGTLSPNKRMRMTKPDDQDAMIEALSPVIARAWTLNASILFANFDQRLFEVYCRVHWYSCSIAPPPECLQALKDCLGDLNTADFASEALKGDEFSPRHEMLYTRSVRALQRYGEALVEEGTADSPMTLPILAGLVCASVAESAPAFFVDGDDHTLMPKPRLVAGVAACTLRTIMEFEDGFIEDADLLASDEILQDIIDLHSHAHWRADPQVVLELWQLEDRLMKQDKCAEAAVVRRQVFERLESFVEEIPADWLIFNIQTRVK